MATCAIVGWSNLVIAGVLLYRVGDGLLRYFLGRLPELGMVPPAFEAAAGAGLLIGGALVTVGATLLAWASLEVVRSVGRVPGTRHGALEAALRRSVLGALVAGVPSVLVLGFAVYTTFAWGLRPFAYDVYSWWAQIAAVLPALPFATCMIALRWARSRPDTPR